MEFTDVKILGLRDAIKLYSILKPYSLELSDDMDFIEIVGTIIKNIRNSENHNDYIDAITLMTGHDKNVILMLESSDVLEIFTKGLLVNRFMNLIQFAKKVGIDG